MSGRWTLHDRAPITSRIAAIQEAGWSARTTSWHYLPSRLSPDATAQQTAYLHETPEAEDTHGKKL